MLIPTPPALPPAELVGTDVEVDCLDGRARRYANFDYAASAPPLAAVRDAVDAFLPWCSSVHRGSGLKSQVATEAFEGARAVVRAFVGGRPGDDVVHVRNTTEAINVVAAALPGGSRVLTTAVEHHANLLPWRRHRLRLLPCADSPGALLDAVERAFRRTRRRIRLLAVTGASNVTGEVWPLAALAAVAHRHGALLLVDGAQLAPHRAIDMAATGIDLLALSGHKLYAPYGGGALIGALGALGDGPPLLRGGGAVALVTARDVLWADGPARHEAGSPNVVGAVALAAACRALTALGMDAVAERERALSARLAAGLAGVPGLVALRLWPEGSADRVGVHAFTLAGVRPPLLAAALSAEHGIGVRHGCFCAHLLIARLLGVPDAEVERLRRALRAGEHPELPGAVRASLGLGSTEADVDRLVAALHALAAEGPRARYRHVAEHDDYVPVEDGRARPAFLVP